MKKFVIFLLLCTSGLCMNAQLMWNFKGGIMSRSYYEGKSLEFGDNERESRTDWMVGLELEIPLNEKWNLDTGLRYKNHYSLYYPDKDDKSYWDNSTLHLELPLRLTYKQPLGKHFSLHAGIGPYVSGVVDHGFGDKWHNKLQVGLEPSVAINWSCFSLGMSYNLPCFYRGYKDENKPVVMATLGIRFKTKAWEYIGAGLLAVASVGAAAAAVWPSNNGYNNYSSDSYDSSYSSGTSRSSSSSSGGSISGQQNYNTDKRTYANYDSQLSAHFYGGRSATAGEVRQWQQAMKKLRTKWTAKGKSFTQSSNETRSTSNCSNSSHSH